jgi:hypothetical protein
MKRGDSKMESNCSSHETGLAIGYYSLIIQNILKNL